MDIKSLQRALRRKLGASESRKSHHVYFFITVGGRELRAAKFSHSSRGQLSDLVISDTTRRLRLRRNELDQLVECSLDGEDVFRRLEAS